MNYFAQESSRLKFRQLTLDDIESWMEFFDEKRGLEYLGIDLSKDDRTLATDWINKQLERYNNEGLGHLAAVEKSSGQFIGMGGIIPRVINGKHVFEIAYSIKPQFRQLGFATEIARQMKNFGFKSKIADSFISIIHKNNIPSLKVAINNGMEQLYESEFLGMDVYIFGNPETC
ncbi:MAG: GNAT family N-acetyltransferase [Bacteroidetes bacterium]|nr:GNAT family N-acetyltransferase [Bacteroidota bacterium]